jgi:hydrogenase maturation protease
VSSDHTNRVTVVLGIGNVLLSDDGAGVHAARSVQHALRDDDDVIVIDGGTLSFSLAPEIENASRLIVIDAAQLHAAPGTVRTFFGTDMDRFLGRAKLSVHEVSLVDLLDIARLTSGAPRERVLVAIQPDTLDWGEQPSPTVSRGVAEATAVTLDLLQHWPAAAQTSLSDAS